MHYAPFVAMGAFIVTSLLVWVRVLGLYNALWPEDLERLPGPRERRRLTTGVISAVGLWQVSVAATMRFIPGTGWGDWFASGFTVALMGVAMMAGAAMTRRIGLP